MKLADLINANHNIILLLPRFGIHLGFGDRSVQSVCQENHISTDFFLLICNIYTFDDYLPDHDDMSHIEMPSLVSYLEASHRYYINERLPHLERHFSHIADHLGAQTSFVLRKYFEDYKNEIADHFALEEKELFPQLSKLKQGEKLQKSNISRFVSSHDNLKDKLSDLTQIIYKYLPGDFLNEELMELVLGILQLAEDLEKHELIEERLLIPEEDYELSDREKEVLVLVSRGLSSKAIAEHLHISVHTVNSHRKNITQKTGIRSVAGLAVYAMLRNL